MIYRKYVGREVLLATALILGAFMVLFAFFDLMGELGKLGEGVTSSIRPLCMWR